MRMLLNPYYTYLISERLLLCNNKSITDLYILLFSMYAFYMIMYDDEGTLGCRKACVFSFKQEADISCHIGCDKCQFYFIFLIFTLEDDDYDYGRDEDVKVRSFSRFFIFL